MQFERFCVLNLDKRDGNCNNNRKHKEITVRDSTGQDKQAWSALLDIQINGQN